MKRRGRSVVLLLTLLLIGGAVVNVAVAWGCMAYAIHHGVSRPLVRPGPALVELTRHERNWLPLTDWPLTSGRLAAWMVAGERFGVRVRDAHAVSPDWPGQGDSYGLMTEFAAGWPFFSMHGCDVVIWDGVVKERDEYRWLLPVRERRALPMDPCALPLHPIWPGFAINTLFYAAILWLLFAAPFALRRRMRIKRGQCAKCGYDLRGSPARASTTNCPECGTPLPSPAR